MVSLLVILALAIAVVVAALLLGGRKAAGIVLIVLLGLLTVGGLLAIPARISREQAAVARAEQTRAAHDESAAAPSSAPAASGPLEEPFIADVYPSAELAARAAARLLASRMVEKAITLAPQGEAVGPLGPVLVTGHSEQAAPDTLRNQVAQGLQASRTLKDVRVASSPPGDPFDGWTVTVKHEPGDGRGAVRIAADRPGEAWRVEARMPYVEKPWAAQALNGDGVTRPLPGLYLIRQQTPVADAGEARGQNLRWLAFQLYHDGGRQHLLNHLIAMDAEPDLYQDKSRLERQFADQVVTESRDLIQDEFLQTFERPYGKVYTSVMKVAVPPDRLDRLARHAAEAALQQVKIERKNRAWAVARDLRLWLGMAAVVLGVAMLYVVANALTRGYYAWRLRAAAGLCMAGGVAAVLHVMNVIT